MGGDPERYPRIGRPMDRSIGTALAPALSAHRALATVILIAALAAAVLRSRRFPGWKEFLAVAALVAAGVGCGSQEPPAPDAATRTETEPATERPLPRVGDACVNYSDGRVTVRCKGLLQLAVLEQLAEQAGFEIVAGKTHARPITLQIERASLVDAIASVLDGLSYTLRYDLDEASGARILARVEIGKVLEKDAAKLAKATPTNPLHPSDPAANAAIRSAERAAADEIELPDAEGAAEQAELLSNLDSPDPEARADAVDWIELDAEALRRVVSLLESDPDPEVRATIVDRLGDEESPAAVAALIGALRDPDPEVVLRAIEALEIAGGAWLIPEIEPLLTHSDPEVREAAGDAKQYWE